jgi:hypothetical protein
MTRHSLSKGHSFPSYAKITPSGGCEIERSFGRGQLNDRVLLSRAEAAELVRVLLQHWPELVLDSLAAISGDE